MVEETFPDLKSVNGVLIEHKLSKSQFEGLKNKEYHLKIKPDNPKLSGDDGFIYEWLRVPITATDESIPTGSELFEWIKEVERIFPETAKIKTHEEVMEYLLNRKLEWVQKKVGKSFKGFPARYYWVPNKKIEGDTL